MAILAGLMGLKCFSATDVTLPYLFFVLLNSVLAFKTCSSSIRFSANHRRERRAHITSGPIIGYSLACFVTGTTLLPLPSFIEKKLQKDRVRRSRSLF